ncbi:MAG: SPOR domain-containing protein [Gammaproteobacteria bacterium]|nr:SPOR domain-containing protein [Gammaproteobacteria bacterium]
MKVDRAAATRARQDPEFQLKHRVTGAAIIAAAAGLAVALLLGEPGGGRPADGDAQTIRFDLDNAGATGDATAVPSQNDAAESALVTATVLPDAGAVTDSSPRKNNAVPPTIARAQPGWAVRVGAFAKQANLDAVTAALNAAGFQVNAIRVTAKGRAATSLWLGPYSDQKTARAVRRRVFDAGISGDAEVVKYKP